MPDPAAVGTISSWVAAAISLATVGFSTARAMWNRSIVDWVLVGEMQTPVTGSIGSSLRGKAVVSNIGDGDAHRVTVYIGPRAHTDAEVLARSPLLKPGDSLEMNIDVGELVYDHTSIWVTWTYPPIRRHRQKKSPEMPLNKHLNESQLLRIHVDRRRREQDQGRKVLDEMRQRASQKEAEKRAVRDRGDSPSNTSDGAAT